MKKIITFFISLFLLVLSSRAASAITDPLAVPNNRFGIHIFSESDLEDAARLVNSTGGDWGYVTFVITEGERNHARWQEVFNRMRRLHLIPIVRIATKVEGSNWATPKYEEINNWLAFLNSLNWVTQNRYVVIGNEPNHAKEWGGEVDPRGYATYLRTFSQKAKEVNENFFVLPAGLDASAPSSRDTMEEAAFIREMLTAEPDLFEHVDGWNSHSYPNPGFSGSETARGKGTIGSFIWEADLLKSLGVAKELPVFITETGWVRSAGVLEKRFPYALQSVWNDKRIVAVTPFILNYSEPPFDAFSWKERGEKFYPEYEAVRALPKEKGTPQQIIKGDIIFSFLEPIGIAGYPIKGIIYARNTGQNIWDETNVNVAQVAGEDLRIRNLKVPNLEPSKLGLLTYEANYPETPGETNVSVDLTVVGEQIAPPYQVEITSVPPKEHEWGLFWERVITKARSAIKLIF